MSVPISDFEVCHVLRLRGVAPVETVAGSLEASVEDVRSALDALVADGSVLERQGRRVSGFVLTEEGKQRHDSAVAILVPTTTDGLGRVYESFLDMNGAIKRMCSEWQGIEDEPERWDAIARLEAFHHAARVVFESAGSLVPRFARYGRRLQAAVTMLNGGEERYFTSPLVDSYHTVWFEAHEDFLISLGLDRGAEGSF